MKNQRIGPRTGSAKTTKTQRMMPTNVRFLLRAMLMSAAISIAAQTMPALATIASQRGGMIGFVVSDPASISNLHHPQVLKHVARSRLDNAGIATLPLAPLSLQSHQPQDSPSIRRAELGGSSG